MGYLQSEESKGDGTSAHGDLVGSARELRGSGGGDCSGAIAGHAHGGGSGRSSAGHLGGGGGLSRGAGLLSGSRGSGGRSSRRSGAGDREVDLDGNTSGSAGILNGGDGSSLVFGRAGLLDARNDLSEEGVGLAAVALEVGELSAAVGSQRANEAGQSALGDVVELGRANSSEGGNSGGGGELHFDVWFCTVRRGSEWVVVLVQRSNVQERL